MLNVNGSLLWNCNGSCCSLSSVNSEKCRLAGEVQPEIPRLCPSALPQRERGALCSHAEGLYQSLNKGLFSMLFLTFWQQFTR